MKNEATVEVHSILHPGDQVYIRATRGQGSWLAAEKRLLKTINLSMSWEHQMG